MNQILFDYCKLLLIAELWKTSCDSERRVNHQRVILRQHNLHEKSDYETCHFLHRISPSGPLATGQIFSFDRCELAA